MLEDFDETVRRLWNDGLTYSLIAAKIGGGKSRSAIASTIRRLRRNGAQVVDRANALGRGWQRDTTALKAAGTPRPRGKQSAPRPTPMAAGEARVAARRDAFALSEATAAAVTLMDVREGQCRWPLGEPGTPEFRFCACKATHGPYCDAHANRAFEPRRGRRNDAAAETDAKAKGTFHGGCKPPGAPSAIMDHWL